MKMKPRVLALRKAVWARTDTLKFKTRWSEGECVAGIECDEVTCVDAITLDDIININSGKTVVKRHVLMLNLRHTLKPLKKNTIISQAINDWKISYR
jgi:uncharacterized protein (DUF2147 family)